MSTLWTFGDSFTFGHGCRPDGPLPEYCINYKNEGDDVWPNHLGKMLNVETKNFGICGASNDTIIDTIIDNWDSFKENDFVIIGITWHSRFDLPRDGKLETIYFDWEYPEELSFYNKEELETILNFQYYFSNSKLYKTRHLKRLYFLDKILKEKKINTFLWDVNFYQHTTRFEKIADCTNPKMNDYHFSFKGHKDFANMLYKKLINPTLI